MLYRYAKLLHNGDMVGLKENKCFYTVHDAYKVEDVRPPVIAIEIHTEDGWRTVSHREVF